MKYYEVVCFTPYCGEQAFFYLEIPDNEDIEDDKWCAEIGDFEMENAYEWYDDDAEDDYGNFGEYLLCCHNEVREITKAEYDKYA